MGGNPFDTTSIYALIHYLERKWGVYFCMAQAGWSQNKGPDDPVGYRLQMNTDVLEICTEQNRVTGIKPIQGPLLRQISVTPIRQPYTARCCPARQDGVKRCCLRR